MRTEFDEANLPAGVVERAFRYGSEFAWSTEDIQDALRALGEARLAVLGIDLWIVHRNEIYTSIPTEKGPGVWGTNTSARRREEPWPEYCRRTAEESIREIISANLEELVDPEIRPFMHYLVTFTGEDA